MLPVLHSRRTGFISCILKQTSEMYGGVTENVFFQNMFDDLNLGPECFLEISREPCQLNFCVVYQVKKFILFFI